MPTLDTQTLLVVIILIYWLMGALTLLAALHGRSGHTLLWSALANLINGLAFLLGFASGTHYWGMLSVWLSNMLLIAGYGCIWTSLRNFAGKPTRWLALVAGAVIWIGLCNIPAFTASTYWRIVVFSVLTISYLIAALVELQSRWHEDQLLVSATATILGLHAVNYIYRIVPHHFLGTSWISRSDVGLTIIENMLFIVSLSFAILVMVRARGERQFRHAASHDELTGLANRRVVFERGPRSLQERCGNNQDIAILMCDLDRFKRINDQYGHKTGDCVLALFADVLQKTVRETDLCARIGGEEFVVIATTRDIQSAEHLANRVRMALEAAPSPDTKPLSVSIGVACASTAGCDLEGLLARADEALYAAKNAGRNRVCLWTPSFPANTNPSPPSVNPALPAKEIT